MARIRNQLAEALRELLPSWVELADNPATVTTVDPQSRAVVQLIRMGFEPAPADPQGHFVNDFDLFLIEPSNTVDTASEDRLDDLADELAEHLMTGVEWAEFGKAERQKYADTWPAYKFTITIASERR